MRRLISIILSALFFLPAGAVAAPGSVPIDKPPVYRPPIDNPPETRLMFWHCQDVEFLETATQDVKDACFSILRAEVVGERNATIDNETQKFTKLGLEDSETGLASYDLDTQELVFKATSGLVYTAEVDPNEERDLVFQRGALLFGSGSRSDYPGGFQGGRWVPGGELLPPPIPTGRIDSCDEYATVRFGDYADYFREIEAFGADYRAIFEYVFGNASAVGGRGLHDRPLLSSDGYEFDEDQMEWPILRIPSASRPPIFTQPVMSDPGMSAVQIRTRNTVRPFLRGRNLSQLARPVMRSIPALSRAFEKGTQTSSQWFVPAPKNEFFALTDAELQYIRDHVSEGEALYEKIQAGREYYDRSQTNGWRWHWDMSLALASEEDVVLLHHRERRSEFTRVLADVREIYPNGPPDLFCDIRVPVPQPGVGIGNPVGHCSDSRPVDLMVELLKAAEAEGCLDIDPTVTRDYDYGPCDWSPQDLHEEFVQVMSTKRHAERLRCVEMTASADLQDVPAEDRNNTSLFDEYLALQEAELETLISSIVAGDTEPPRLSHSWEADDSYGTDRIGASWQAYANFSSWDPSKPGVCGFNPAFDLGAHVSVKLWPEENEQPWKTKVFNAAVAFDLRDNVRYMDLEIVGNDFYEGSWENHDPDDLSVEFEFSYVGNLWEKDKSILEKSHTFMVYHVPVTVAAGLYGRLALDWKIEGSTEAGFVAPEPGICALAIDLKAAVTVEPNASLYTEFAAGIGIPKIWVAAFGQVTLARVGLPVTFAVGVSLPADDKSATSPGASVYLGLGGVLTLSTLNGHLGVFLEMPLPYVGVKRFEKKLYSWNGISTEFPLFYFGFNKKWSTVTKICETQGVSCDG